MTTTKSKQRSRPCRHCGSYAETHCQYCTTKLCDRCFDLREGLCLACLIDREKADGCFPHPGISLLPIQAAVDREEGRKRHLTPLGYLHRYWREVDPTDRLRFLTEMLTPNERRALVLGFADEDDPRSNLGLEEDTP